MAISYGSNPRVTIAVLLSRPWVGAWVCCRVGICSRYCPFLPRGGCPSSPVAVGGGLRITKFCLRTRVWSSSRTCVSACHSLCVSVCVGGCPRPIHACSCVWVGLKPTHLGESQHEAGHPQKPRQGSAWGKGTEQEDRGRNDNTCRCGALTGARLSAPPAPCPLGTERELQTWFKTSS